MSKRSSARIYFDRLIYSSRKINRFKQLSDLAHIQNHAKLSTGRRPESVAGEALSNQKEVDMPIRAVLTVLLATFMSFMSSSQRANAGNPCAKNPCAEKVRQIRKNPLKDAKALTQEAERLWKDASLGRAGVSCSSCHPNGNGLKREPFPKYIKMADDILTLDQMINFCMMNPMKGKPLSWNSVQMTALAAYARDHATDGEAINPCSAKNPCGAR